MAQDMWAVGEIYEAYVGRWSRRVAADFVAGLDVPGGRRWLDVGCGTGALTTAALTTGPAAVLGLDRSVSFLGDARRRTPGARFAAADARELPVPDAGFDVVVSGLALNFVPDPPRAVAELVRVAAPGAVVAAYVWDYAEGMTMMRHFWDAAAEVDPSSAGYDEGRRFTMCRPEPLRDMWAALADVDVRRIVVPTPFADFDDLWRPFLGGIGAAPAYLESRPPEVRSAIRAAMRSRVPDAALDMTAAAWAVRGRA